MYPIGHTLGLGHSCAVLLHFPSFKHYQENSVPYSSVQFLVKLTKQNSAVFCGTHLSSYEHLVILLVRMVVLPPITSVVLYLRL